MKPLRISHLAQAKSSDVRKRLAKRRGQRKQPRELRPRPLPLGQTTSALEHERAQFESGLPWLAGALLFLVGGLIVLAVGSVIAPSMVNSETDQTVMLASGSFALVIAAACVLCAVRGVPSMPWLHVQLAAANFLIGWILASTGDLAATFLPLLVMPLMMAAFFLPLRQCSPQIAICIALIAWVWLEIGTNANVAAQCVVVIGSLAITAAILMFARGQLQRGLTRNLQLAGRDPLTGVANLRRFNQALEAEIRRASRQDTLVTLLMIDLDDFKRVNDEYSHTLGDAVLIACARAMQAEIRADELLVRRGGDEFAVIAVHGHAFDPAVIKTRLEDAIRREREALCPGVSPEGSIGYATWQQDELPQELVIRADEALHNAKRQKLKNDDFHSADDSLPVKDPTV